MDRIRPPAHHWRGTLADVETKLIPGCGVCLLAYMGQVIYVGRAIDVADRLRHHMTPAAGKLDIDQWLQTIGAFDPDNVRLDVLETPEDAGQEWKAAVEEACIQRFHPLFNSMLAT